MQIPVNQRWTRAVDRGWRRLCDIALGDRCLLCQTRCDPGALCRACANDLPRNLTACLRCAAPLPTSGATCGACLRRSPPLEHVHAAFVYRRPLDTLLPRLKFHRDLACAQVLGNLMADAMRASDRPDALVPVPLHRARLGVRGYDQSLELARPVAAALKLPIRLDLLRRVRATDAQSKLDAVQRRRNLRGAFDVATTRSMPQHVVLIDDVMTTGATLHAAARALRRAGVDRVDAWVCARVP